MSGIQDFERIIDRIETDILDPDILSVISKELTMSVYEFRRIFTFLVGMSFGEYVRLRKLSLACIDLQNGCTVLEAAEKYGYTGEYSFSRAFKAFFGFSPAKIGDNLQNIKLLTRPKFQICISNTEIVEYGLIDDEEFFVDGVCGISDVKDTECCETIWQRFCDAARPLSGENVYAVYENNENSVRCTIGYRNEQKGQTTVKKHKWMTFTLNTTDDKAVNDFYRSIHFEYLPSSHYVRDTKLPIVEVFPENMDDEGFLWQIRIPVVGKEKKNG